MCGDLFVKDGFEYESELKTIRISQTMVKLYIVVLHTKQTGILYMMNIGSAYALDQSRNFVLP